MRLITGQISKTDILDIANLYEDAMEKIWSQESIAETFFIQGTFALLNEGNSGFSIFRILAHEAEIFYIGVVKTHRRQGLATALLSESVRILKEKGVGKVFLEVSEENLPAINFYKKSGFTVIGKRLNYYRDKGRMVNAFNMALAI